MTARERTTNGKMIRHFTNLCKSLLAKSTDIDIFIDSSNSFRHQKARCPHCGANGKLASHGDYARHLVAHVSGETVDSLVRPNRFKCGSCKRTHALLPDITVPYSPYSIRFKLCALVAYYERDTTVREICCRFGIAVSTLYEWKALFTTHIELLFGVLQGLAEPAAVFLRGLLQSGSLSDTLRDFHSRLGRSFMQRLPRAASWSRPP